MNSSQIGHTDSIDPAEIAHFAKMAREWWDPHGKFAPLHRLNPVRLAFIRDNALSHFQRQDRTSQPLAGLKLIDIGCGGGLLCEPMCRLGAAVTGIDPAGESLGIARIHAEERGLAIDYRQTAAEELAAAGEKYDIVLAMEVVEHVADVPGFLSTVADLARPGGLVVLATINRTLKALGLAVIGAEYVLGWLPRGTHRYEKLVRPQEIEQALRQSGVEVKEMAGVSYRPLSGEWVKSGDLSVNYMMAAGKPD